MLRKTERVTVVEAAKRLGVPRGKIYMMVLKRELKASKRPGSVMLVELPNGKAIHA
jgi:excisionase family DNA binding protein